MGRGRTGQDGAGRDGAGLGRTVQGKAGQGRTVQCSAVQGRMGQQVHPHLTATAATAAAVSFSLAPPAWLPACCSECAMCGLPWPTRAPARLADVLGASWLYVVDVTNCLDRVLLLNTTTVVSLGGREGGRCSSVCI